MDCKHAKLKLNTTITNPDVLTYVTDAACLGCNKTTTIRTKAHELGRHTLPEMQKIVEKRAKKALEGAA